MMKKHHVWLGLTMMMILATLGSSALRAEDNSTPQQVFDGMRQSFQADKAKGFHARFSAEEIEVAPERATDVERDVQRLKVRISRLDSGPVLAVLHDRVVDLEFSRRRDHVVGAIAFVKEIAGETKFPIVIRIVNERRFGKDAFQPQMIGEKPDQTAARSGDWIRID